MSERLTPEQLRDWLNRPPPRPLAAQDSNEVAQDIASEGSAQFEPTEANTAFSVDPGVVLIRSVSQTYDFPCVDRLLPGDVLRTGGGDWVITHITTGDSRFTFSLIRVALNRLTTDIKKGNL